MKTLKLFYACAFCLLWTACNKDEMILPVSDTGVEWRANLQKKVTGDVEVLWMGNAGNHNDDPADSMASRQGFVSLEAFAPEGNKGPKGNFTLEIMEDNEVHRLIEAGVIAAFVNPDLGKAWFLAEVMYDSKACGEHGGSGDHEDGEDCDHGDGEEGHDDGCNGEDSDHGNGHISGQNCRIGQIVAVKVHDVATPGVDGDGISWKWFAVNAGNLPDIDHVAGWPHLCNKTILDGNLVIH